MGWVISQPLNLINLIHNYKLNHDYTQEWIDKSNNCKTFTLSHAWEETLERELVKKQRFLQAWMIQLQTQNWCKSSRQTSIHAFTSALQLLWSSSSNFWLKSDMDWTIEKLGLVTHKNTQKSRRWVSKAKEKSVDGFNQNLSVGFDAFFEPVRQVSGRMFPFFCSTKTCRTDRQHSDIFTNLSEGFPNPSMGSPAAAQNRMNFNTPPWR